MNAIHSSLGLDTAHTSITHTPPAALVILGYLSSTSPHCYRNSSAQARRYKHQQSHSLVWLPALHPTGTDPRSEREEKGKLKGKARAQASFTSRPRYALPTSFCSCLSATCKRDADLQHPTIDLAPILLPIPPIPPPPIVIASLDAARVLIKVQSIRSHNGVHSLWQL